MGMGFAPTWLRQVSHPPPRFTWPLTHCGQNKKLSWCWQTRATRLEVSQRSTNIVPFHMLRILSSCAIVTLSLRFFSYIHSTSQNVVTLKYGSEVTQGHW